MFIYFSVDEYGWWDTCNCHKCLKIIMVGYLFYIFPQIQKLN